MTPLKTKVIRSVGWMAGGSYAGTVIAFAGNLALAYLLLPENFGEFALASSILAFVFMLSGFGSQEAIIQNRDENLPDFIPTAFWISIGIGIFLSVIGILLSLLLTLFYEFTITNLAFGLSLIFTIEILAATYAAVLQREFHYREISIVTFASILISFLAAIYSALIGLGVWALFVRAVVDGLGRCIGFGWVYGFRIPLKFNIVSARWIWSFGWRIMVVRISEVLFGRFDSFLVGTFLGANTLGHYVQAYRLSQLGQQFILVPVQSIAFSTFSELQKSLESLRRAFVQSFFWIFRLALLFTLLVFSVGQQAVVLVYGTKWLLAGEMFQMMWIFLGLLPLVEHLRVFLIGIGHVQTVVTIRIMQIVFFVPLIVLAVYQESILWVIFSVTITTCLSLVLFFWKSLTVLNLSLVELNIVKPMLSASLALFVIYLGQLYLKIEALWAFSLVWAVALVAVYMFALLVLERQALRKELGGLINGF